MADKKDIHQTTKLNFLNTTIAILGLVSSTVAGYSLSKSKKERGRNIIMLGLGVIMMIATIINGYLQDEADTTATQQRENLKTDIENISMELAAKIKSDKQFEAWLKEEFKIIRDSSTNKPVSINEATIFKNKGNATSVKSYNQRGGQTAGAITNNH